MNDKLTRHLFPVLVLIMSLITIFYYRNFERNHISLAVSLIGIFGVILYYLKSKLHHICFHIWIFAQFLLVYVTPEVSNTNFDLQPVFVAVQFIFLKFSFTVFTYKLAPSDILHIEFNLMPVLFYFLYYGSIVEVEDTEN